MALAALQNPAMLAPSIMIFPNLVNIRYRGGQELVGK